VPVFCARLAPHYEPVSTISQFKVRVTGADDGMVVSHAAVD
jgi:hypothetical protein